MEYGLGRSFSYSVSYLPLTQLGACSLSITHAEAARGADLSASNTMQ